jgi:FMN phosphatase YigB (HAD superfamily)
VAAQAELIGPFAIIKSMTKISFIYFDLGGVTADDFSGNNKWQELGDKMGLTDENREGFKEFWQQHESEFCTTDYMDSLQPALEQYLGIKLPNDFSLQQEIVDRFYRNEPIVPIIEDTKTKTRIGLLTNVSPGMLDMIIQKGILPDVQWNEIVDSSVEHVMKPNPRIFEIAQNRAHVPANEILFVDNKQSHCDAAAAAVGWQTFYYDSADRIRSAQQLADFLSTQQFSK